MIDVSVVVVTYREDLDLLKACFDSVARSRNISYELIVVDNGANEATRGLLHAYDRVQYLSNAQNLGFAAAVNIGMRQAGGRYVLLLNPDAKFEENTLAAMITHLDEDQNVGIASCLIKYPDGTIQESIRRFPSLKDQLMIMLKLPHLFRRLRSVDHYMMREAEPHRTQDVDSIMGAFMFIRRDLMEEIGLFDERYFMWFEEVDYCRMAHDAGWKIRHYADISIEHLKGHTFAKLATLRKQKWIRASLRKYMRKHHGNFAWMILWLLTPLFVLLAILAALIKPR